MTPDGTEDEAHQPNLLVRPFGYVENSPIVRRISTCNLYLGNASAAESDSHDQEFEHVLSATRDEFPRTTHHCPLIDGPDNEWASFKRAVDTARTLYRSNESVLIHCNAGISRSSTLIATTLAVEDDRPFREALAAVQEARPHAMPHPALHELAVVYLASRP